MKNCIVSVLLTLSSVVVIQFGFNSYASAQFMRHMVIYGGFKDTDVYRIAKNIDILVVGKISYFQLKQLKQVNAPGIRESSGNIMMRYLTQSL